MQKLTLPPPHQQYTQGVGFCNTGRKKAMLLKDITEQFRQAMLDSGIVYEGEIIADGQIHRFHIPGQRQGSKNGAYAVYTDNRPAGWFKCLKQGITGTWSLKGSRFFNQQADVAAIEKNRIKRKQAQLEKNKRAAIKARFIWNASPFVQGFSYLTQKDIEPHGHGARLYKQTCLILPLFNTQREIVNIQFIASNGDKRFLAGGQKKGCFWWIGKPTQRIVIAEGYATAATLFENTGLMCFIASDAGNIKPVAVIVRALFPRRKLVIAVDNDVSGTGQKKAYEAAVAVSALVSMPPTQGHDWNDHYSKIKEG